MDRKNSIAVFDDVLRRLALAVEREEALQFMSSVDEQALADADRATQSALDALQHAVTQPRRADSENRALEAALHTVYMAWLIEDSRDRGWALDAAVRHPSFTPLGQAGARDDGVGHRIDQLRGIVERLGRLTSEPFDEPSPDMDGPGL